MNPPKTVYESIDAYIAGFPPDIQHILTALRNVIREAAPEAKEKISYQMPTYELHGNLVHFAAFKNHIGFYPAPSGIEAFADEVKPYHKSKGTLQFPLDQPLPNELIARIVKYRVAESKEKAAAKTKKK
ncbi:iron chaperone [Paenibacillus ginsengarvi]|uniref:YdhG-like domain-containing protein n=1 Tax=Paenibacillus ginsengarvi TaxID=400777 RepID=A0A3B0C985_9BACL|nr:DUF1801 domain-containing protein [Paenibacillus ginsengarvi]RKN80669.1 hypothetical protein D7M11_19505 [Paenibacillus ginsengarvi]